MGWMLEADEQDRPFAKQALKHNWFLSDKKVIKNLLEINSLMCQ